MQQSNETAYFNELICLLPLAFQLIAVNKPAHSSELLKMK